MKTVLMICILVLLLYYYKFKNIECMSGQEVYEKTNGSMNMNYSEFKKKVPSAHIVNYSDFKELYKNGKYNPENINKKIQEYF